MTVLDLLREKKNLEDRLKAVDTALENAKYQPNNPDQLSTTVTLDLAPWKNDILWQLADIVRTSPINPHYPYGYDCSACAKCEIECTTDGDGADCNWAFMSYFERELIDRGYFGDSEDAAEREE